jgi:proline dehydrogenase
MDSYQKMCDTNKNVIKMGVIIKEVYYITIKAFAIYLRLKFDSLEFNVLGLFISQGKLDGLVFFILFLFCHVA